MPYDSQGVLGYTKDKSIIEAERKRCFDEYGIYDGYIYSAMIMNGETMENPAVANGNGYS